LSERGEPIEITEHIGVQTGGGTGESISEKRRMSSAQSGTREKGHPDKGMTTGEERMKGRRVLAPQMRPIKEGLSQGYGNLQGERSKGKRGVDRPGKRTPLVHRKKMKSGKQTYGEGAMALTRQLVGG